MIDQFQSAAESAGCIVKRFPDIHDGFDYISSLSVKGNIVVPRLPVDSSEVFKSSLVFSCTGNEDADVCVSFAVAGIAETGSLLLDLSNPEERIATALPQIHAVFIKASSIVRDMYALADTLERLLSSRSSYLSITTGPSRTADIERVLTIGVHGPRELHVLVLDGE